MGKMEHTGEFNEKKDFDLDSDLNTSLLADALGVSKSDLNFLSTIEQGNTKREQNFVELVAREISSGNYFKHPPLHEVYDDYLQVSREPKSMQRRMQRISVELRMLMKGLTHPKQILDLLTQNTAAYTFYDIDSSKIATKVKSFHYEKVNSDFIGFIAEFDNPRLLLDRLNKLKINISVDDIAVQREKATELLNLICQIPEEHFQKAVSDLNEFNWLGSCDIIEYKFDSDVNLDKDFVTRLRVLKNGGLSDEEKGLLKTLNNDSVIYPSIRDSFGLETVLDNTEFLKSMHVVLSEEARVLKRSNNSQEIVDKVKMLEERGVLSKLSTIFSSGITFSEKNSYSFEHGTTGRAILDSISLDDDNNDLLELIELTYDNLTNKEFILMRSFLEIFTIEKSGLVKDALKLFELTKMQIESLNTEEKKKLFKSLRSGYSTSVSEVFDQIWANWLTEYDFGGNKKVVDIMLGILKLDSELNKSKLELAIRQQIDRRSVDKKIREDISSKSYREGRLGKVDNQEFEMLAIDTVRIDKDHVVDQNMDIIQLNESQIRIQLFLKKEVWESVLNVLNQDTDDPKVFYSAISYSNKEIVDSISYRPIDGLDISVASDGSTRATVGLVDIHVDLSKVDKDIYIQEINLALSYLAGLGSDENLLSRTDEESDKVLIKELYKLNTKEEAPPDDATFERKAVFEGYETFTIPDRHKVLKEKYGSFATFHRFYNSDAIAQVLINGMFSSHQRYKRGVLVEGWSTLEDFKRGGANSVFTRTISEHTKYKDYYLFGINLILDPQIWDRLDFYLYGYDRFGDTSDAFLQHRLSPEEYLSEIKSGEYDRYNEQMFRRGIPPEMFKGIVVETLQHKDRIIKQLTAVGVTIINGKSLEDFIYLDKKDGNAIFAVIDIAEGLPIGTTKERRSKEQSQKADESKVEVDEPAFLSITDIINHDVKVKKIIEIIADSNMYVQQQFESSAHISEGYTIQEHSKLIGAQYDKYFIGKHSETLFTCQEMRVGLSLHGIGKHLAFDSQGSAENHYSLTKGLAQSILNKAGFTNSKMLLMSDILSQNAIGKYLQSGGDEKTLVSSAMNIVDIAKKNMVSVYALFDLLRIHYICVASSRTEDATGDVDYMNTVGMFDLSKPGEIGLNEEKFEKLMKLYAKVINLQNV